VLDGLEDEHIFDRLGGGVTLQFNVTIADQARPAFVVVSPSGSRSLAGTAAAIRARDDDSRRLIATALANVIVEAVVTFPPVEVPSHQILSLGVGDVIALGLPADAALPLEVDGHHLADVRPARAGAELACQVVSTVVGGGTPFPDRPPIVMPALGGLL
jgi:hypothetical protein